MREMNWLREGVKGGTVFKHNVDALQQILTKLRIIEGYRCECDLLCKRNCGDMAL